MNSSGIEPESGKQSFRQEKSARSEFRESFSISLFGIRDHSREFSPARSARRMLHFPIGFPVPCCFWDPKSQNPPWCAPRVGIPQNNSQNQTVRILGSNKICGSPGIRESFFSLSEKHRGCINQSFKTERNYSHHEDLF